MRETGWLELGSSLGQRALRRRPPLGARGRLRLPRASVSLGQPAAWAAWARQAGLGVARKAPRGMWRVANM
jgi:hypothetical protein